MKTQTTLLGLILAGVLGLLANDVKFSLFSHASMFAPALGSHPVIKEQPEVTYTYKAELVRVIDGDTQELNIDLGFGHWLKGQTMRLHGIDTPETRTRDLEEKARGQVAEKYLRKRLASGELVVQSILNQEEASQDSFGRWLAILFVNGQNINDELVEAGHAEIYGRTVAER